MASKRGVFGTTSDDLLDWNVDDGAEEVNLPDVKGWRILVLPVRIKTKTDGGVHLSEITQEMEQKVVTAGKVYQIGDLAYRRADMLVERVGLNPRNGEPVVTQEVAPWCKVGDWVIFGKYAGMRLEFKGLELRILNDDEIIAVLAPEPQPSPEST